MQQFCAGAIRGAFRFWLPLRPDAQQREHDPTAFPSDGTVLHLADNTTNDRGSAFTTTTRVVSGFSTAFQFRLSNRGGTSDGTHVGADGFVFVIQRAGNTSLSTSNGESLGYLGIGLSIGIEFDTFKNTNRGDPDSNHMGIDLLGSVNSVLTYSPTTDFDDGALWTAWIDYDGTTLQVRANETGVRPSASMLSYPLSLSTLTSTLGGTSAYVGFTASTGGGFADHDIVKWTYSETYLSGGVTPGVAIPEPAGFAAIAAAGAFTAVAVQRRVRRRIKTSHTA